MIARLPFAIALAAAAPAFADVSTTADGAAWASRCGSLLRTSLSARARSFARGRAVVAPDRVEYRVGDPRGAELVAALIRVDSPAIQDWERDDQWNYPIEPRLLWRERRAVPDYSAQVAVFRGRRADTPPAALRTAFIATARAALDECIAFASHWRAPSGSLRWTEGEPAPVDELRIGSNGAASHVHYTGGGSTGSVSTASADDVDPVIEVLRQNDLCALRSRRVAAPQEHMESIEVQVAGAGTDGSGAMSCRVTLPEREWLEQPRARACRAAVIELFGRLFRRHPLPTSSH